MTQKSSKKSAIASLFEDVITVEDAADRIRIFTEAEKAVYEIRGDAPMKLKKLLPSHVFENVVSYMKSSGYSLKNARDLTKLREEAEKYIKNLPVMFLAFAFEPSRSFLEELDTRLEQDLRKRILLKVDYQPSMLGGIEIGWQGKIKDYSLKKGLDEYFEKTNNI